MIQIQQPVVVQLEDRGGDGLVGLTSLRNVL